MQFTTTLNDMTMIAQICNEFMSKYEYPKRTYCISFKTEGKPNMIYI